MLQRAASDPAPPLVSPVPTLTGADDDSGPTTASPVRAESIDDSFDPDATLAEPSLTSQDALAKIFPTSLPGLSGSKDEELASTGSAATASAPLRATTPAAATDSKAPASPLPPLPAVKAPPLPGKPPVPRAGKASVPPPTPAAGSARPSANIDDLPTVAVAPLSVPPARAPEPQYAATDVSSMLASPVVNEPADALPGVPAQTPPPFEAPTAASAPLAPRSNFPVTHTPSPFEDSPGGDSGVFTKTLMGDEAVSHAVPPAKPSGPSFARAESPDVYTRTVADAHVILPSPPTPNPAARAGSGRPSDVLPRPPVASVVQPGSPAAGLGKVPSASVSASISVMPSAYALESSEPSPAQYQRPTTPAPPGYSPTPAPQGYPGTPPPQGYPAGYASTPRPPAGYQPTPPPLGGYGPPPALEDGSYPSAALDALGDPSRPDASNAVWRQAHPSATRWAAKRTVGAPITPRPGIIALGLMLAGVGAYLLLIFLPSKAPLTAAAKEQLAHQAGVDELAWHFSAKLMSVATVNAAFFVLLGVVVLLQGALHRPQGATRRKKMSKTSVLLFCCFGLLSLSFIALLVAASVR